MRCSSRRCTISSSWWHGFLTPRLTIRPRQRGCPARTRDARGASIRSVAHWPEPQVAWKDELFERIGLRHRECGPIGLRESDCGHVVDRRRSGEPRTREHHRHLTGVRSSGEKSTPAAGMFYAARCKAIDEQDDIVPGDKLIGQPSLRRVMHPSTAVQSDDRGKQRPRAWPDSLVCGRPQ